MQRKESFPLRSDFEPVAFMLISNAERQQRIKRDADIEALRAATTKAELALVQAENDLLRQRVRALETALARRENCIDEKDHIARRERLRHFLGDLD
jgi:hypothetical protein